MISQAKRKHGELFSPAPRCGQTPDLRRGPLTTSSSKKTICAGIFIQRDCWMKAVLETGSPLAIFRHRQIDTKNLLRPTSPDIHRHTSICASSAPREHGKV